MKLLTLLSCIILTSFISSPHPSFTNEVEIGTEFSGKASYYGVRFHGRKTANGEIMDKTMMTCAHKTLPFGTMLEVINPRNNKSAILRVNDRGPYAGHRIIDVSVAAAKQLGMIQLGVATLNITIVGKDGVVYLSRPNVSTSLMQPGEFNPVINDPQAKKNKEVKRDSRNNE